MQIFAKLPSGRTVDVEVEGTDTLSTVASKVFESVRDPKAHPSLQQLHFNGRRLEQRRTVAEYAIGKEDMLQVGLIEQAMVVKLNVRGTPLTTTLETLLADRSSVLYSMFEPLTQGGEPVNAATARIEAGATVAEGVPLQYGGRPGPLPCDEEGVYFIDSNPISFGWIVDHLCSISRRPVADGAELAAEGGAGGEGPAGPPPLPDSVGARAQLALEARFYGLEELASACDEACGTGADVPCHSLATLVKASGPGVTLVDILSLSGPDLSELLGELGVNVVLRTRIKAEVAAEQARRQAELEAERAAQALRASLVAAECPVSEAGARALHAAGIELAEVIEMDAATAQRRAGVSAEDAQLIAALEHPPFIECAYPGAAFGEGGVLHRIGTDHGRRAWVNPHEDGQVVAAMSSVSNGAPHKFVGRSNDGQCYTNNEPNSWMSVDLGEGHAVVPTHYCLRHDENSGYVLRNWTLEGKGAGPDDDWQQIRRHDNDQTMAAQAHSVGAWPVDPGGRAFRHFRIRQHGPNNRGTQNDSNHLMCCGFEVYGELHEAAA